MSELVDKLKKDFYKMPYKEWLDHATVKLNMHYRSMKMTNAHIRRIRKEIDGKRFII